MMITGPTKLLLLAIGLLACGSEDVPDEVAGDAASQLSSINADDRPAVARALLDSDRPWRAAMVMRQHLAEVPNASAEHRILAARAEAGWGAWAEASKLLEPVTSLDTVERGIGVYILARAHDETGDGVRAIPMYREFLSSTASSVGLDRERRVARLRLGLALAGAGDSIAAQTELRASAGGAVWLELLHAEARARTGDTAAVRQMTASHTDGISGLRAWRMRIDAARHAGDLAGARRIANQARAWADTDATRAEFLVAAARAAIEMGDTTSGRDALRAAIDLNPAGAHPRAASDLLREGRLTAVDHVRIARVLAEQGFHEEAAESYRRWLAADVGSTADRNAVHMELATALFYANDFRAVAAALRPIARNREARLLRARTEAHRGKSEEAARMYLAIAKESPGSGAQPLFLAAGAHHDAGDASGARTIYRQVVAQYPGSSQMGLALMRLAGMSFVEKDYRNAAATWDAYRERYPRGDGFIQATYWAGRAREEMGDTAGAALLYRVVRERERDSYYGMRASERLGEPFWPLPMRPSPPVDPAAGRRVQQWMQGIDLLRDAGFAEEASMEADRVVSTAGSDRPTRYALAEALAERGYAQRAIRIGLDLQGNNPPDLRLLRILFPFPYRTLITEEAKARGLDPFLVAALIRQESMFEARITSPAGARGLMQIMPATAARLAAAADIPQWQADLLFQPEINVHLGTRYVAHHMASYAGSLPSVFSAYNAGAHRVDWWKKFPEYADEQLFTERIPFAETRGYVRILTRNRALYSALYGTQ